MVMESKRNRNRNRSFILTIGIMLFLIMIAFLVSLNVGAFSIKPMEVIKTFVGMGNKKQVLVLFIIRLPRIITAILVAIGLSVAGSVFQGVTKNDLADPGILGIGSGAALGVVMYIYFMNGDVYHEISKFTIYTMPLVALIGGFIGAMLVYLTAYKRGIDSMRLILVGVGINSAFNAILIIFQLRFTTQEFNRIMIWTSGSIWGASWEYIIAILPWITFFSVKVLYKARYLDVLSLGDEISTGLGVKVEKERRSLIICAVVLCASATAVAGNIAFVGLIAPHIARRLVGPAHKRLIPVASMIGTLLLLCSDTIARNVLSPVEVPVGIVVSIIGVPYFIYLMLRETD